MSSAISLTTTDHPNPAKRRTPHKPASSTLRVTLRPADFPALPLTRPATTNSIAFWHSYALRDIALFRATRMTVNAIYAAATPPLLEDLPESLGTTLSGWEIQAEDAARESIKNYTRVGGAYAENLLAHFQAALESKPGPQLMACTVVVDDFGNLVEVQR